MAPPGVMPSQQPMNEERNSVTQYFGRSFQTDSTTRERDAGGVAAQRQPLFHGQEDFADAEQADDGDQEVDAAQEFRRTEGHAQLAGHGVHADAGEQEAERHRNDRLVLGFTAEPDKRAEREQIHREEFGRPEFQRERRDHRRQERDQHAPRPASR